MKQSSGINKISAIFKSVLIWAVTIIWGYFVFKNYYSIYGVDFSNLKIIFSPWQYSGLFNLSNLLILKHLFNILLLLVFLFSVFGIGRIFLRLFRIELFNFFEEFVFSIGLGFAITAYLVFLIGFFGFLYAGLIRTVILLFIIIGFFDLRKNPVKFTLPKCKLSVTDFLALIIFAVTVFINLAGALSPEISYDSLVYHLAVPNYYKLHHMILDMPYVLYSNLPLVHGMLFTAGIIIKDEFISKLMNYSAGLLTCAVLFSITIRHFNYRVGLWASLIFYTVTHVMTSSWSCGTEMMLTFFGLLSLYSVMNYSTKNKNWLLMSAVFAGVAMGVKYTGLFVALGALAAYLCLEKSFSSRVIKNIFVWGLISSFIVMPWLAKNYMYKNNPVYPFMGDIFPKEPYSDYKKLKAFTTQETRQFEKLDIKNWIIHPWDITMGRVQNSENFTPLFLFLIPVFLLFGKPPTVLKYGIVYFLVIWLTWSFSTTMIRFMMPAFPAAGLIIAYYLKTDFYKFLRRVLLWIVLLVCSAGVYQVGCFYYKQGGWRFVFGQISAEERQDAYYTAMMFINKNLPETAKVLFIGDGRSFYIERIPVVSTAHDLTPIVEFAKASKSGDELYLRLKKEKITHIFFNLSEAIRLGKSYSMFEWDEKSLSVYNDFWKKYVKQIFSKDKLLDGRFANRVVVYEILSERDASLPHIPPLNLMTGMVVKDITIKE